MRRPFARDVRRPLQRLTALVATGALLAGCLHGRPSQVIVAEAERLQAKETDCFVDVQLDAQRAAATSRAALSAVQTVIQPQPGDHLRLRLWSAGWQSAQLNSYPPLSGAFDIRLRRVATGGRLGADEQQLLATFLQVNRGKGWIDPDDSQEGVKYDDRRVLALSLQEREADVWNAFVSTLCVGVAPLDGDTSGRRKTILVNADLGLMCNALVGDSRRLFTRAFLKNGQCGQPKRGFLTGFPNDEIARAGWAAAALDANPAGYGSYYYENADLRSPAALLGVISYRSVRPFYRDAPDWTLTEWEAADICRNGASSLKIKAVRLLGSDQSYRIIDQPGEQTPKITHDIAIEKGERKLVTRSKQGLDWSLPSSALDKLTVRDVDEIVWAPDRRPRAKAVRPDGCSNPNRS